MLSCITVAEWMAALGLLKASLREELVSNMQQYARKED